MCASRAKGRTTFAAIGGGEVEVYAIRDDVVDVRSDAV
jgi:hypothetical protein